MIHTHGPFSLVRGTLENASRVGAGSPTGGTVPDSGKRIRSSEKAGALPQVGV